MGDSAALGALRANLKLIVSYDHSAAVTIAAGAARQVSNLIRGAMHRSRLEHLVAPKMQGHAFMYYEQRSLVHILRC